MAARARHSNSTYGDSGEERYEPDEFWPGERLGPARSRTRATGVLKAIVVILTMLGGGWFWFGDPAACPNCQSIAAAVSSLMTRDAPQRIVSTTAPAPLAPTPPPTRVAAPDPLPSIVESSVPSKTATPPSATERPEAPPQNAAALAPAVTGPGEPTAASPAALPADAADPYQARAAAVGLHPDLSRVLLARLSPADYRNAGIAIQTAVAETPDSGVFAWPRQRKPELAFFQVRFVAGAAPGCRRYVVTITKDGWLTTAPPMERCGPQPSQARRD